LEDIFLQTDCFDSLRSGSASFVAGSISGYEVVDCTGATDAIESISTCSPVETGVMVSLVLIFSEATALPENAAQALHRKIDAIVLADNGLSVVIAELWTA
jgi:hypothetical protein